jgi:hypothetical protein
MVALDSFTIITAVFSPHPLDNKNVYQYMCIQQKAQANAQGLKLLHNFGSSVWYLLHVSFGAKNFEATPRFLEKLVGPCAKLLLHFKRRQFHY